ncbi:MAG: hypothetical protein NT088_00700 [Candidatus Omnitrophica bacterium]|nr:hypothetical protein [Candidatus Omnitrophota bacterium]
MVKNKKGIVLIFSLLATLGLSVLLVALYLSGISENQQAKLYANSTRAFWLAEAGIATVKANTGLNSASGTLGDANCSYDVPAPVTVPGSTNYWVITSTGTVNLPNGTSVNRTLSATVKTGSADPLKFPYAIDTTTDLVIKGNVTVNGTAKEEDNTINFDNMFGVSKAVMKTGASHLYTDTNFNTPIDGITWVDVASGNTLNISGNLGGSGILVINGNSHFSGTVDFNGIIYVIGALTMTGTVTTNGSVVAESSATADTTLKGTVNINFDFEQIQGALTNVQFLSKQIVAWREV